jgi:D-beta-D-heptose 7-phosphate kinase/D-beta-D-heptose 1-phosphate adenosyltransferase
MRQNNQTVFPDVAAVAAALAPLRVQGKSVVSTNGCFDLLHAGHVTYLSQAAALGDLLVVGINCDRVVARLKGSGRPIQNELARVALMGALRVVDAAFIFEEEDPRAFLEILRPDIHVKGGDYPSDIIEKPVVEKYGGRVHIVGFLPGHSTSALVSRMQST